MAGSRRVVDWDYSTLHKTGERIPISRNTNRNEATTEDNMTEATANNGAEAQAYLLPAEESCDEAISDFFDESSLSDA